MKKEMELLSSKIKAKPANNENQEISKQVKSYNESLIKMKTKYGENALNIKPAYSIEEEGW